MIAKQEKAVSKSKAEYDADVAKLKNLYAKKDEIIVFLKENGRYHFNFESE